MADPSVSSRSPTYTSTAVRPRSTASNSSGRRSSAPTSKVGGSAWTRRKARAQKAVKDIAATLGITDVGQLLDLAVANGFMTEADADQLRAAIAAGAIAQGLSQAQ